jgi:hypothetical protein
MYEIEDIIADIELVEAAEPFLKGGGIIITS